MIETNKNSEAERLADAETIARLSTAWLEEETAVSGITT